MAKLWIEVRQDLGEHPKLQKLSKELSIDPVMAVGHLNYFWWWALSYTPDGDLTGIEDWQIAKAARFPEERATEFVDTLFSVGFLDEDDKGNLSIHDWMDYSAGKLKICKDRKEKEREGARERQRRRRARIKAEQEKEMFSNTNIVDTNNVTDTPQRNNSELSADIDIDIDIDIDKDIDSTLERDSISQRDNVIDIDNINIQKDNKSVTVSNITNSDNVTIRDTVKYSNFARSLLDDPTVFDAVVNLYHTRCKEFPEVSEITEEHKRAIKDRIAEGYTLEDFNLVFTRVSQSELLRGDDEVNLWRVNFDWVISSEHMKEIVRGDYDEFKPNKRNTSGLSKKPAYELSKACGA